MEITYIGHSGFLIEWENCYFLFDYYQGEIPVMHADKKIFVFVSHKHEDHFNPHIFTLHQKYKNIQYILSSDIRLTRDKVLKFGMTEELFAKILSVKPSSEYVLLDQKQERLILKTLKSTDCGVAFLVNYCGKTVYHAGDLNLWVWKGETKQYNNNMTAMFGRVMESLRNIVIDIAFIPLDPRLKEWYYMGPECFLSTAKVRYVFPMHFWGQSSIIQQFKEERKINTDTEVVEISREGQKWYCL